MMKEVMICLFTRKAKNQQQMLASGTAYNQPETLDAKQGSENLFNEQRGIFCSQKAKANIVVKNEKDWISLWQKVFGNKAIPYIDFNTKMVIAVFSGEKPTGGYEILIDNINYEDKKVAVKIKETSPSQDAFVTTIVTSPFHIKVVNKSDLPVEFINE